MIKDFSATVIANMLKSKGSGIESFDLEMLDFLSQQKEPLSIKEISEKAILDEKTAGFIVKRLQKMGLCKPNSPTYSVTESGMKLMQICNKLSEKIEQVVSENECACSDVAALSKSIIG